MRYWRPKRGPVLTWGRAAHLVIGAAVPIIAWMRGGYEALGWACVGAILFACGWEVCTPALSGPFGWVHRWGDVVDLIAFAAGVCVAGALLAK